MVLAHAGAAASVLFTVPVIAQGVLQPDYSHIAMPISALAAWPAGWIQNLNFFLTGACMAAFTVGLHRALAPTRFGPAGILLLFASAVGIFMAGLFPWIDVDGVPTETPQHVTAAVLTFSAGSTGLIVLSRRMTADPQ